MNSLDAISRFLSIVMPCCGDCNTSVPGSADLPSSPPQASCPPTPSQPASASSLCSESEQSEDTVQSIILISFYSVLVILNKTFIKLDTFNTYIYTRIAWNSKNKGPELDNCNLFRCRPLAAPVY